MAEPQQAGSGHGDARALQSSSLNSNLQTVHRGLNRNDPSPELLTKTLSEPLLMLRRPSIPYVAGYFHMTLVLFRADYLIAEAGGFFQRCLRGIHYPGFPHRNTLIQAPN